MAKNLNLIVLSLCVTSLLAAPLAASTPPTAVEDCDRAYFGIDREPDFPHALQCYRADKRWDLLIVMYLNGEGAPVDVAKAEALLQEWGREDQIPGGSLEARALRAAIEERRRNPGASYPRIDYCRDVAEDTLTLNFCGYVGTEIAEGRLDARMAGAPAPVDSGPEGSLRPDDESVPQLRGSRGRTRVRIDRRHGPCSRGDGAGGLRPCPVSDRDRGGRRASRAPASGPGGLRGGRPRAESALPGRSSPIRRGDVGKSLRRHAPADRPLYRRGAEGPAPMDLLPGSLRGPRAGVVPGTASGARSRAQPEDGADADPHRRARHSPLGESDPEQ